MLVVRRTIAAVMAFHAQRAEPRVGHRGAFGQRVSVGGAQLMRIGGIVRIVTRRAGDRFVNRVGRVGVGVAGMLDKFLEARRRVATDAVVRGSGRKECASRRRAGNCSIRRLLTWWVLLSWHWAQLPAAKLTEIRLVASPSE